MATTPNTSSIQVISMAIEIPHVASLLPEFEVGGLSKDRLHKMEAYSPTWAVHIRTKPLGNLLDTTSDRSIAMLVRMDTYAPNTLDVVTKYAYCWAKYEYGTSSFKYFNTLEDAIFNMKTKYRMGVKT
jgi:hypothetical protein